MSDATITRWREALLLDGEADPVASGLRELAEYFGISREQARRACETALADSKREWEADARETPEQVLDFYDRTRSYIFEHVWWHVTDQQYNSANVEILDYALWRGARDYLDFGAGVGANAILFARHGLRVTLGDVSRTMLDFARWRLERRGLRAEYLYLREQQLPPGRFDFVTAVDVFEHLVHPSAEVQRISAAMKTAGALVFNCLTGEDPERPMHILPTPYPVLRALRQGGLRRAGLGSEPLRRLGYEVVERGGRGRIADLGWGLYDRLRYHPTAEAARAWVKTLLARRAKA
jgi:2-polyprenyl-3-methyl-5-hydroxy-6-metoxy-1,4-benzoquinol methylase